MRRAGHLKTLEQHNDERRQGAEYLRWPHGNGIACPNCGDELLDINPMMTLTSNPPQKEIHCPSCHYHGYRIA